MKSTSMQPEAKLTIPRADKLTAAQRRDLSAWLRKSAAHLLKHGDNYAPRFTARFFYR